MKKGGIMEILGLIDKLETLVTGSARVPATRKALLDIDKVLELVDQIRLSVPKEIQEAEELLMRRESVMNQALLEARRIRAEAYEEYAKARKAKEAVFEVARIVMNDAQQRAEDLIAGVSEELLNLARDRVAHKLSQAKHRLDAPLDVPAWSPIQ